MARYHEIERWLREQVVAAAPGETLPSESALAARFGVSRMTARHAVQNLALDGLVERRRGAGTFVATQRLHRRAGPLLNFTEDMRRRGKRASSTLLTAELRRARKAELDALGLAGDTRVVAISRVRLGDGVPLAIEHAALPATCAGVLAADLERGSLHEALTGLGRTPTTAHAWITARLATKPEAKLLDVALRGPLLIERRVILDAAGEPLESTETLYVPERYVIDATFTLNSPGSSGVRATAG